MKNKIVLFCLSGLCFLHLSAQIPVNLGSDMQARIQKDELSRYYIMPQRIVWQSDKSKIENSESLLVKGDAQPYFGRDKQTICSITNQKGDTTGLILDFGKEIHGGIQLVTSISNRVTRHIRLRFGESVGETMSKVIGDGTEGLEGGATNHHAIRDFTVELPGYGSFEVGNTGFRFVRIDLLDTDCSLKLKRVRAVATLRDIPYLGSFESNDSLLNKIWAMGAYTVHLNIQDYLWDGIKRDRMVWIGDMHPEVMTICSVFGNQDVVPKSLDFVRDHTPLPAWMNGISAYSMWWIIIQHDWYLYQGNKEYLQKQANYLFPLLDLLMTKVDENGKEHLDGPGMRFLDWPSSPNKEGVHAGLQALMVQAFDKGVVLCSILGDKERAERCSSIATKMRQYVPGINGCKQAAALMSLANIIPAEKANKETIAVGGLKDFSSFFGYYLLQAQALAGDYQTAINNIRQYWGGMIQLGATTFWEDFNMDWMKNAGRIDEVPASGKVDVHKAYGDYCYIGYRKSLCHGWASGPTPWLTQHVLGINVVEPGCKTIRIEPHLGDLKWVKGTFPTPFGVVKVSHRKKSDGSVETNVQAPPQVKIIQSNK